MGPLFNYMNVLLYLITLCLCLVKYFHTLCNCIAFMAACAITKTFTVYCRLCKLSMCSCQFMLIILNKKRPTNHVMSSAIFLGFFFPSWLHPAVDKVKYNLYFSNHNWWITLFICHILPKVNINKNGKNNNVHCVISTLNRTPHQITRAKDILKWKTWKTGFIL